MINIKEKTGIPVALLDDSISFDREDISPAVLWTKSFADAKYAYTAKRSDLETLYFGIRYAERTKDEDIFVKNGYMADLTVIKPGKIGNEFIKTVGHYHQNKPGTKIAYPEVYEAATENIEYLLQSEPDKHNKVDVIWVVTTAGDKVVMPPNYGHVSMNVGPEPIVEVDLQKRDNPNGSDYSLFKETVGGAMYRTEEGLVKNPQYEISSLRIVKPLERPDMGLIKSKPLYNSFIEDPQKFDYLLNPEKHDFSLDGLFVDIEL